MHISGTEKNTKKKNFEKEQVATKAPPPELAKLVRK